MSYQLPNYIVNATINNSTLDYSWDDSDIDQHWDYDYAKPIIKRMECCTLRAKIALSIGIYEWILGRFYQLHDHSIYYQIAEAAWCANVDKRYLHYIELDDQKYEGKVDYALWLAYAALFPVLLVSQNISNPNNEDDYVDPLFMYDKNEWASCLTTQLALLKHVLSKEKLVLLENWLNQVVERLTTFYIEPEENPFANLFGQQESKDWLGDYVAREALDPAYNYQPDQAVILLNKFLSQVDKKNPVLTSLTELINVNS
ncbi:hypothetical protein RCS94_06325 [Orbaceae bacterium ac157xtp]